MADRPPNILVIMTDQQRADALGCAGHPVLRTPHLDRLAARGVHSANAFTVAPLCMPARASLLSGQYPHNHGVWSNRATTGNELPPGDETLFRQLRRAGYATAHIGKGHYYAWNLVPDLRRREAYVRDLGFDHVHETTGPHFARTVRSHLTDHWERLGLYEAFTAGYAAARGSGPGGRHQPWDLTINPLSVEEHLDSYVGRAAAGFIAAYAAEAPLALFVGFGGPHDPWDAPGSYATMYDPRAVPPPIPPAEPGPWVPPPAAGRQRTGRLEDMTEADTRRLRANYYGKITLIDHWIGHILDAVERRGWTENTLVVFLADHGEMAGDHARLHKLVFYESSIRIPLIVSWPGHTATGAVADGLVESIDLAPTILEAAGAPPAGRALGRSLWPLLRDPAACVREDVLSEVTSPQDDCTFMLRTSRHKYAAGADGAGYLLHDLAEDPEEQVNLIGHPDHRSLEAEMRDRLLRRLLHAQAVR